jgi:RRXRR protein
MRLPMSKGCTQKSLQLIMKYVPVVDSNQNPLMPTTANRAASWIKSRKATPFWKRGVFCVRLNVDPSARNLQTISVGIDPGSMKEGYTVKSNSHTYLNIQADAVTWVKKHVETRKNCRLSRRQRKTPYRKCRWNRRGRSLAPSTKARWNWKLRIVNWLQKMYPIAAFVVEDIKAVTKKYKEAYEAVKQHTGAAREFNISFSPLQYGKNWFYTELGKLGRVETLQGYETKELRDNQGLHKSSNKLGESFDCHCVDSWVLANWFVGGHARPDNKQILFVTPLRFHRRQLHVQNPVAGGIRRKVGSTISLGFKRGSLVKYSKKNSKGLAYVGGTSRGKISLCSISTGKRLGKEFSANHLRFLTYNTWRTR